MSNLQKTKRFDLTDKFNDTSRYLDDIFTIDNSEFAEYTPDVYQKALQLNKVNTSDKGTSFFYLRREVVVKLFLLPLDAIKSGPLMSL